MNSVTCRVPSVRYEFLRVKHYFKSFSISRVGSLHAYLPFFFVVVLTCATATDITVTTKKKIYSYKRFIKGDNKGDISALNSLLHRCQLKHWKQQNNMF